MRHRLRDGEHVTLHLPPTLESNVEPEDVPLYIRYEDAYLLIVEKPAGMLVHPAGFEQLGTLANGVVFHLLSKGEPPVAGPVTASIAGRRAWSSLPSIPTSTTA